MVASNHRSRDAADTGRGRITDVAADLFLRRGYAQTSLRDIADRAGIKAGSIYYHFDSKESLFLEILQQGIAVMEEAFVEADRSTAEAGGHDRIRAHVRAHLSALFEHGPYTSNHVSAFHIAPEPVRDAVIPDRDRYESMWTGLLDRLRDDGDLADDIDVAMSRLVLFGAMNYAIEWFDPARGNLDHLAQTIADHFWNGVAA